uniref:Uncharacterized protein n=1 Tax=Oryza glumipatula TaxID=40148 RepID=A0A0D9ZVV6_9ORYZ
METETVVGRMAGTARRMEASTAAGGLGRVLRLRLCRYSRGEYLFPEAQPFPHADFADEVAYLDSALPGELLLFRRSAVMSSSSPDASPRWHVYSASSSSSSSKSTFSARPLTTCGWPDKGRPCLCGRLTSGGTPLPATILHSSRGSSYCFSLHSPYSATMYIRPPATAQEPVHPSRIPRAISDHEYDATP